MSLIRAMYTPRPRYPSFEQEGIPVETVDLQPGDLADPVAKTESHRVNEFLSYAANSCLSQLRMAKMRGDVAGMDAWRIAFDTIQLAETQAAEARANQDWHRTPETK